MGETGSSCIFNTPLITYEYLEHARSLVNSGAALSLNEVERGATPPPVGGLNRVYLEADTRVLL